MVIAISILVSTVVFAIWPVHNPILRFLAHLAMLPLIVGISYEFNRWAGRHDGPITASWWPRACGCRTSLPLSRTTP